MITNEEIGKRIRDRRVRLDMTQEEVASSVDTNRQTVGRWEAGTQTIDIVSLQRVADFLRVSLSYLLPPESDEWAPDGAAFEVYFKGLPPDDQDMAVEMIKAAVSARQRAATTNGKKADLE